jgi:hypothetical protein
VRKTAARLASTGGYMRGVAVKRLCVSLAPEIVARGTIQSIQDTTVGGGDCLFINYFSLLFWICYF